MKYGCENLMVVQTPVNNFYFSITEITLKPQFASVVENSFLSIQCILVNFSLKLSLLSLSLLSLLLCPLCPRTKFLGFYKSWEILLVPVREEVFADLSQVWLRWEPSLAPWARTLASVSTGSSVCPQLVRHWVCCMGLSPPPCRPCCRTA